MEPHLTCRMGSHSVTCYPRTHPALTPARQAGTRFIYLGGMEGSELTLVTDYIVY